MKYLFVAPEVVDSVWNDAGPMLSKAVNREPRELTLGDLKAALKKAEMDLWLIQDDEGVVKGAGVTKLFQYVDGLCVYIRYLGGEGVREWFTNLWPEWSAMLKSHGIKYIVQAGRPGWTKILPEGWKPVALMMMKELT